jgi:hypothetical protein
MKALGVLESKWDPIRKKLVRRLLEEQDKVLRSYFALKGGTTSPGRVRAGNVSNGTCMREDFCLFYSLALLSFVRFVVN